MCDKKAYDSYSEAVEALKCIKRSHNKRSKIPTRAYYCSDCGKYHLTSQSAKNKRKLRTRSKSEFNCKRKHKKDFVFIKT